MCLEFDEISHEASLNQRYLLNFVHYLKTSESFLKLCLQTRKLEIINTLFLNVTVLFLISRRTHWILSEFCGHFQYVLSCMVLNALNSHSFIFLQTKVKLVRDSEYTFKAQTGLCHYFDHSDFGVSIRGFAAYDFR